MKQTDKKGSRNKTGAIGEEIAAEFLRERGFKIVEQNYLKKWGEIDLVACPTGRQLPRTRTIKFIEVKAVSYETKQDLESAISRGTWRPEENVHHSKIKRLNRAIESWIAENNYVGEWEIDVVAVRVVPREKYASVKYLENVIFG